MPQRQELGVAEAERSSVFRPVVIGAGTALVQLKLICTSVVANEVVGVKAKVYVCNAPAIFTGILGVPITPLVAGSVV